MAEAIISKVPAEVLSADGIVSKFELSKIGKDEDEAKARYYINIFLNPKFLEGSINNIFSQKSIKVKQVNMQEESK